MAEDQYHRWGRVIQWYLPNGTSKIVEAKGFMDEVSAFKGALRKAINEGWTPPTVLEPYRRREYYWRWSEEEKKYALAIFARTLQNHIRPIRN